MCNSLYKLMCKSMLTGLYSHHYRLLSTLSPHSFLDRILRAMPHCEVLTLHTGDSSVSHRLRLAHMRLHKPSAFLEYQSDTQQKHRNSHYYQAKDKHFQHKSLTLQLQFCCKDKC